MKITRRNVEHKMSLIHKEGEVVKEAGGCGLFIRLAVAVSHLICHRRARLKPQNITHKTAINLKHRRQVHSNSLIDRQRASLLRLPSSRHYNTIELTLILPNYTVDTTI